MADCDVIQGRNNTSACSENSSRRKRRRLRIDRTSDSNKSVHGIYRCNNFYCIRVFVFYFVYKTLFKFGRVDIVCVLFCLLDTVSWK